MNDIDIARRRGIERAPGGLGARSARVAACRGVRAGGRHVSLGERSECSALPIPEGRRLSRNVFSCAADSAVLPAWGL